MTSTSAGSEDTPQRQTTSSGEVKKKAHILQLLEDSIAMELSNEACIAICRHSGLSMAETVCLLVDSGRLKHADAKTAVVYSGTWLEERDAVFSFHSECLEFLEKIPHQKKALYGNFVDFLRNRSKKDTGQK